ncbi:MAG: trehalose-phosphatase, partial [Nocardioidaceae bacterium]
MTADTLTIQLRRALAQLARTPQLLVACDYDGTLAPIVPDRQRAVPLLESVTALRSLAALPATTTAVISGRVRFQATVTAIGAEPRSGSTVYRYNRDDALPGGEGGFH